MANSEAPLIDQMAAQLRTASGAIEALMRRRGDYLENGALASEGIRDVLADYEASRRPLEVLPPPAVHVLFGKPDVGEQPVTFTFATEAERKAFMDGVIRMGQSGDGEYVFCESVEMAVMADGELRRVPAGVDPEGPVVIYELCSADRCVKRIEYGLGVDGRLAEMHSGAWLPHEPDSETTAVNIEIFWDREDSDAFDLTGDQHRALEDGALFEQYLTLLAKRDPDGADELLQEAVPEGVQP